MAETTVDRVLRFREAGKVRRCHLIPHHGEYTVGQHSWDAVSLLLALHPAPTLPLVKAVMWHDAHERQVSDVSRSSLQLDAAFAQAYEKVCTRVDEEMGISAQQLGLTKEDSSWLRAVDFVEFYLWCCDQVAFGNRHAAAAHERMQQVIAAKAAQGEFPAEVRSFLGQYQWRRTGP